MKRLAMENAFKMHVLRQLAKSDPEIGACQKAVNFSIQAARGRMVNATMPTTLLSDLFDVITLDHCQLLFECVERNVAIWKEELFFAPVKNNILRICNGADADGGRIDFGVEVLYFVGQSPHPPFVCRPPSPPLAHTADRVLRKNPPVPGALLPHHGTLWSECRVGI